MENKVKAKMKKKLQKNNKERNIDYRINGNHFRSYCQ